DLNLRSVRPGRQIEGLLPLRTSERRAVEGPAEEPGRGRVANLVVLADRPVPVAAVGVPDLDAERARLLVEVGEEDRELARAQVERRTVGLLEQTGAGGLR